MYVAFCTINISYTNPWHTGLYIVCTCLYDSKRVHRCVNMYIHVWAMYVHVWTTACTYHVHTMFIHVYTSAEMYIHVCTCLCFSIIVCQLLYYSIVHTLYIHGTDMSVHVYARWSGFQMILDTSNQAILDLLSLLIRCQLWAGTRRAAFLQHPAHILPWDWGVLKMSPMANGCHTSFTWNSSLSLQKLEHWNVGVSAFQCTTYYSIFWVRVDFKCEHFILHLLWTHHFR